MEKNPCYEDYTVPEYEEVPELKNKAAEPTDARVKMAERSIADNTNLHAAATSIKKETNLKVKCIHVVFSLSILTAIVAAMALSVYTLVSSNQGMNNLMQEIQELKLQLNKTKEASEANIAQLMNVTDNRFMTQLNNLESSVSSLNTANGATMTQLNNLESLVSSLNTANEATMTQLNSLESSVSSLNTANGATTTQLNSLQSSVGSLTTRVNSPVNLYQNCIQETRSCTLTQSDDVNWRACGTTTLPVDKSGYYTLSMACKYDSSSGSLKSTALRQSGSNVDCVCKTTSITSSSGEHLFVNFSTFTCTLVITRCPISQNIV
ncbi:uncharacterized protein LOC135347949 isoform X2 [Halichondria panicea]|uniref:uncharacterized protein LOC135347949 isoform X2 n=1 Tax=Halichondria panicea TaxID=6063 RepID=UPI00312B2D18